MVPRERKPWKPSRPILRCSRRTLNKKDVRYFVFVATMSWNRNVQAVRAWRWWVRFEKSLVASHLKNVPWSWNGSIRQHK
jgi:hypothetical protein